MTTIEMAKKAFASSGVWVDGEANSFEANSFESWDDMVRKDEREVCAKEIIERGRATKNGEWHGNNQAAHSFAEFILADRKTNIT